MTHTLRLQFSRSQPTYEELKRWEAEKGIALGQRSQPTYEELKQDIAARENLPEAGSQPTYEELKQFLDYLQLAYASTFPAYL